MSCDTALCARSCTHAVLRRHIMAKLDSIPLDRGMTLDDRSRAGLYLKPRTQLPYFTDAAKPINQDLGASKTTRPSVKCQTAVYSAKAISTVNASLSATTQKQSGGLTGRDLLKTPYPLGYMDLQQLPVIGTPRRGGSTDWQHSAGRT